MKDAFFAYCERVFCWIYRVVTSVAYWKIVRAFTCKCPDIPREKKKEIRKYWKDNYHIRVNLAEYKWYQKKGVELDPRLIPACVWQTRVEPHFCNLSMMKAFSDKNYLDMFIGRENVPVTLCRGISGQILNQNYEIQSLEELCETIRKEDEVICKPSVDSGGGRSILFLQGKDATPEKIREMADRYKGDFVIQRKVKQHPFFAKFNPDSLNTMRIVSLLFQDQVHILAGFFRVGAKGMKLDNVSSGGVYMGINKDGILLHQAYMEDFSDGDIVYNEEMTREFALKDEKIPFWDDAVALIRRSHCRMSHFKLVYWDIAITPEEKPVVIECNLIDTSMWDHQMQIGPVLGDLTEDVLREVLCK